MKYFYLLRTCFKLGIINTTAYRGAFLLEIFQSAISIASALIGFEVIFLHTQSVNGWSYDELLTVVSVYFLAGGVLNFLIKPNMILLMKDIWDGKLDYLLLKPIYSQVLVSMRKIQTWRIFDIIVGFVLLGTVFARLGQKLSLTNVTLFVLTFVTGVVIIYSFYMVLTTIALWTIKMENLPLVFESLFDTGRWPVGVYPLWLRISLVVIVPIAVAVTIPAQALIGIISLPLLVAGILFAGFMFVFSCWFWRFGIRYYTGASS